MRAIGYIRVSSIEQTNGTSLSAQTRQIQTYAELKGLELIEIASDPGVSGSIPLADRPGGKRALELLESGEASALIIVKLDRGFRSASDCLNNVESFEKAGISLHILNLGGTTVDTATPAGKFFITVMAGAAELERNLIRERCNDGRKARQAEGKRIGQVPFGFTADPDGKLYEDPNEQRILARMRSEKAAGRSYKTIANALNGEGITTKKGALWTPQRVYRILKAA